MKKLLLALLALFMLFAFVACSSDEPEEVEAPPAAEVETQYPDQQEEYPEEEAEVEEPANETEDSDTIVGPAAATMGENIAFTLPTGWEYAEGEGTISIINANGALVLVQAINRHTEDLSGDLTTSMEVVMMSAAISAFADATQNEMTSAVNDMQYPAVFRIYSAQINGTWRPAMSMLLFGEEQVVAVHKFDINTADDFIDDELFPFLHSIVLAG